MKVILLRCYDHEILYAGKRMLILGFILPTAFLSMWISNTATTAMMVPILEAVIAELESAEETDLGGDTTIEDTMGLNRF